MTTKARQRKSDNIPIQYMMAASESGGSVAEFLELSPAEFEAWVKYSIEGPSEARTQLLLAQLIQIVSSALGGSGIKLARLLPWYAELTKPDEATKKKRHEARGRSLVLGRLEKLDRKKRHG